jgi:tRNA A37 threonylcarbamoyltransferase TsaD
MSGFRSGTLNTAQVSNEFTVPLCAIHHTEAHTTGDEWLWWEQHEIDPLTVSN